MNKLKVTIDDNGNLYYSEFNGLEGYIDGYISMNDNPYAIVIFDKKIFTIPIALIVLSPTKE